ncbi:hypothetical protein [Ketobacter sp.]
MMLGKVAAMQHNHSPITPTNTVPGALRIVFILLAAAGLAVTYCLWNLKLIDHGHFHEDAYIMFIYVQNILNGYGEAFYPGGPPAEGATDFLWLMLLCGAGLLGIDPGSASIALNAFGVFVMSALILWVLCKKVSGPSLLLFLPWALIWIYNDSLVAAVGGFSVYLYSALCTSLVFILYQQKGILWLPALALVVGLFRPDGVIFGLGAFAAGAYIAFNQGHIKHYLAISLACLILAITYFGLRLAYFGEWLPLPLYVKGAGELFTNSPWAPLNEKLLVLLGLIAALSRQLKTAALLMVPAAFLFIALLFAHQSQNVGYRFQAPIYFSAYFLLFCCLVDWYARTTPTTRKKMVVGLSLLCLIVIGVDNKSNLKSSKQVISNHTYINQFSFDIRDLIPDEATIVLTEAGRMAFWNQHGARIVDLVGLNSVYPAKHDVDVPYVASLNPSVVMFHHAFMVDTSSFKDEHQGQRVVLLNNNERGKLIIDSRINPEIYAHDKVLGASVTLTAFLKQYFDQYFVYLVDYQEDDTFRHIYGFRKDQFDSKKVTELMKYAFQCDDECLSYTTMIQR